MLRSAGLAAVLVLFTTTQTSAGQAASEPKAFLRSGPDGYYVGLVLDPAAAAGTQPERVSAAVYRDGQLLTREVRAGDAHGAAFTMPLGALSAFGGDGRNLLVAVSSYPAETPSLSAAFVVPVTLEV